MTYALLLVAAIFVEIILFICLALIGYFLILGAVTVPWVRTRSSIAKAMLNLAEYKPHERVLDLGSGDGTIVFEAVAQGGGGAGMEQIGLLVRFSRLRAMVQGCTNRTQFIKANIFSADFPQAQVITSYLFPAVNARVEPRLKELFPRGTRVVSRDFGFPTLHLIKERQERGYNLFLYEI